MLELFLTFAKIGLFTFGGGYAMISLIEDICVEQKKWITHEEMVNVTIVAESTPGPIAINCATYVGYRQKGFLGSMVTTLGIVLPSFVIIYIISMFLDNFLEITVIASAFKGIKLAVGLLILNSLLVLPAASARNIARNLKQYHGFSVLFALFSGIAGLTVSYFWGCSAGAAISLILALIFAATFACRKGRS